MMKNETYFEFDEELMQGYTTIPNYILNDSRLTYKAVGVYVQILQYRYSGKHKVYLKSLSNYRQDKKCSVSTALKELEECGYITRKYIRNDKGQMNGMKYIIRTKPIVENVENTTNSPKSENPISDKPLSENTTLINKISKKENGFKKENNVVDVVEKSHHEKVIDLYKTFKIQKRLMPQMINLLKKYSEYMSLDIFEYVFIQAAEDSVNKKYNYIENILKTFYTEKIFDKDKLLKYNEKFKESKNNKSARKVKTRFHNFNQTFTKYTPDELEEVCMNSQKDKFSKDRNIENDNLKCNENYDIAKLYEIYLKKGIASIDAKIKDKLFIYIRENNLFAPNL